MPSSRDIRNLFIAFLIGALANFATVSFLWGLEAHQERMYGLKQTTTMAVNKSPLSSAYEAGSVDSGTVQLFENLNQALVFYNSALVIDGQGDGLPGLQVLDPAKQIPWLNNKATANDQYDYPQVYLFEDTYCSRTYQTTQTCPLLPIRGKVIDTIPKPQGTDYDQYAVIPSYSEQLSGGRFIFTNSTPALIETVSELLSAYSYKIRVDFEPPLWLELATNPLICISFGLFLIGIIFAAIYWRILHERHAGEYRLRNSVGATQCKLLLDFTLHTTVAIILGIIAGIGFLMPLVELTGGAKLPVNAFSTFSIAAILGVALLLIAYGSTLWFSLRKI